ncbi:synaptic vesicular amine transporter-like isoform X2 [Prorops nasuta]|uniref:synaptic vesicular amine transporter-like isoform X2 n=1 Tax=Prorops nasuta TaxID=863751 RepID=UPI0034CF9AB7
MTVFSSDVCRMIIVTVVYLSLFLDNILLTVVVFAIGRTYEILFLARSIQGISSACIGVSGMSLVASQYPEEDKRSKVMGFVLGSIALGVLFGYPIGSVLYDLQGKMAPFLLVSCLIVLLICLQIFTLDIQTNTESVDEETKWLHLLSNCHILIIAGAIWCSTSPMAILEPCLPIWLRSHVKPKKWQLGTVFIPDSLGYLVGTNFFSMVAYRYGRSKVAVVAMLLVGMSSIFIPLAGSMSQLVIPHLGMGLGIGVADAALVPLLASLVDRNGNYGPVYSIQQVAVSLAYSLGPILGAEMVRSIGFRWVMQIVGVLNIVYCPLLIYLAIERRTCSPMLKDGTKKYETFQKPGTKYERFQNSDDDL